MTEETNPYKNLREQDFLLPDVPQPYLPGMKNHSPRIYIGLNNWNYKETERTKNSVQPFPGTLPFYAKYFNAVLMDSTHETFPKSDQVEKWGRSVENGSFKFCPRFHKYITDSTGIDIHKLGLTKDFIKATDGFKEKLGTALLSTPLSFEPVNADNFVKFLAAIPPGFDLSVELISPKWYNQSEALTLFAAQLNKFNKGLVITDTPERRDIVHMQLSNATAFIRFYCDGGLSVDEFRLVEWKRQLKSWFLQGLKECYFFLHISNKEAEDYFIDLAKDLLKFN